MTDEQIFARLGAWRAKYEAMNAACDELSVLTGALPDCRLLAPVHELLDAYTNAVAELIGDTGDWLGWYAFECDMGCRPKAARLTNGREITVNTLADLVTLIRDGT